MTTPLTIAHIIQWFEVGGGEHVALQLAGKQVRDGHRVMAVALRPGADPMADAFRQKGVSVHRVRRSRPGLDPTLYGRLLAFFALHRPDVVHTHDPHSMVYAAAPGATAGAAVVHTKHGVVVGAETGRQGLLMRGVGLFVHGVVAISDDAAEVALANQEVRADKLHVIKNGVDVAAYTADAGLRRAVRQELQIPAEAFVVGTVGRVEEIKDQAMLVRAMAPLLNDDARLVIVGDGSQMAALQKQVEQLEHGHCVHLLGMRDDVPRLLQGLDVFALSSRSEGLPLALLEGMATGLAVVATAVGGIPAVVREGATGFLSPAEDHRALRKSLTALRKDRALTQRMGAAAAQLVLDQYSLDHTAEQYMALYRQLKR